MDDEKKTTVELTLYSAEVCPFAHRTRLVLAEKDVEFEHVEIDLKKKPDDFGEISPYGKVPVIVRDGARVWESAVINEYLDEVYPNPPMLPEDAHGRALARIWVDFANTRFVEAFYKVLLYQGDDERRWRDALHGHLETLDRAMTHYGDDGPWFFGEQLTLVDCTLYPWFERFAVLEHYRDVKIPRALERLQGWREAMRGRPTVEEMAYPGSYYVEQYESYANRSADGETAKEMRGGPARGPSSF